MKQHTKILFVIAFCLGVLMSADAQKNKTKNTKPSTKEDIPLPPPPMEELKEVRIDTLSIEEKAEADASSSQIPSPQIEFDTTAIPDDLLTNRIKEFMALTKQMELSAGVIKKIYENEDMKALMPDEFRRNFIKAYEPDGDGFKYLELMYIKSYRKYYTVNDLNEFIKFYHTPAGKKMTLVNPLMLEENTPEATKIGKWVARKLI
jgi:hypothetical protein